MKGSFSDGGLQLSGDHWLRQPPGYVMVGLRAQVQETDPTSISGTVEGSGCTTFSVQKTGTGTG